MDCQRIVNEENDESDQTLSPFIQFETQDDENNSEKQSSWSHQKDLDDFFIRIYQYHQKHGFFCIVLTEIFGLIQFVFIVSFTLLIVQCIDYRLLFHSTTSANNRTDKIRIHQVIQSPKQCLNNTNYITSLCLILSIIYWFYRLSRTIYDLSSYFNIRAFYSQALDIKPNDLLNMTWHDVQQRLLIAQRTHHLCIHKLNLTELDIHNRLLRFKNYEIAFVNKGILPSRIHLPIFGNIISFTNGFKFNIRLILFWGPYAPFDQRWHLRQEYKIYSQREKLAQQLSRLILFYALINFLLSPFIFIWQVLNLFYGYTELVRREPGVVLGSRRWSNYGRLYLRHFNELDHSLNQRLSRGYKPAIYYMNSFVNYGLVETAKFISFTSGAILAVLLLLTIYDEDLLNVEHMLTLMTSLGIVVGICRSLIPDENAVFNPEQMLQLVLAQVHYQPDSWKDHAHTDYVQTEFGQIFQLKYIYFLEELLSPIITPMILCFQLRRKSLQIIDFLRNYTIDVQGIGDICSFAQLDIGKHGDLKWFSPVRTTISDDVGIMNDGKIELSLMHFHHTNPKWQMPKQCEVYLEKIQERGTTRILSAVLFAILPLAVENMRTSSVLQQSLSQLQNPQTQRSLDDDLQSSSMFNRSTIRLKSFIDPSTYTHFPSPTHTTIDTSVQQPSTSIAQIGISKVDVPYRSLAPLGVLSKIHMQMFPLFDSLGPLQSLPAATQLDMNVSCLFMHELRHKYKYGDYEQLEYINENQNSDCTKC